MGMCGNMLALPRPLFGNGDDPSPEAPPPATAEPDASLDASPEAADRSETVSTAPATPVSSVRDDGPGGAPTGPSGDARSTSRPPGQKGKARNYRTPRGKKDTRELKQTDHGVVVAEQTLLTMGDAVNHVVRAVEHQIEMGVASRVGPNEPIFGDAAARTTFYTLLPDAQQREVFLHFASQMRVWPRLRALFGAPPYNFLNPEDGGMLRAAGIAAGRTHMAHQDGQSAASYAQFGTGQLVDELEREYRVTPPIVQRNTDPLPWRFDEAPSRDLVLQVRVKKRTRAHKAELFKDTEGRKTLTFPRPGDQIRLRETNGLLQIQRQSRNTAATTVLRVRRVIPRGENAATAAVLATIG